MNEYRRATTNFRGHGDNDGFKELQVQPLDVKQTPGPPDPPGENPEANEMVAFFTP